MPLLTLAKLPAGMIENAYLSEPSSALGRVINEVEIRLFYLGFFLPMVAVDMIAALMAGVFYGTYLFLTFFEDAHKSRLEEFSKYSRSFNKNAVALLVSPLGLIMPKLVELDFNEKKSEKGISAGGSSYHNDAIEIRYPENNEAIKKIILEAAAKGYKVMPMGAGFSQGKQFIPEGTQGEKCIVVDLSRLNNVKVNADEKIATVGAGAHWSDIQTLADKCGLALQVMQASNVFSVGGSVSANIHGWNHRSGMLSNTIISLDIINAKGEQETLTPNDPQFNCVVGGYGLIGIITSVKFALVDNVLLKETGTAVKLSDYVTHFYEKVLPDDTIHMHLYRLSLDPEDLLGSGVAVDYVCTSANPITTPALTQEITYGTRANRILGNVARRMGACRKLYWDHERDRLLANTAEPITTNAVMQPIINAMFHDAASEAEWLQEYFLPHDQLKTFLHALGRLLMQNAVVLLNASVRFVKQNNKPLLSYAEGGDRFAVVLCFTQSLQHRQIAKTSLWLREAQRLALDLGGTYYLPYQHVSNPEDFNRAYPKAAKFKSMKLEVDPREIFASGLYQKYFAPKVEKINYFRKLVENDAIKERFTGVLTVVLQRVEAKPLFALLEEIMRYKETHAEIYQELCHRLSEIMPTRLGDFRHVLQSLSTIKADLGEQAALLLEEVKTIDGLVEIGYPGRFVDGFKQNFDVKGKVIAVYEQPAFTDHIQTGSLRSAYDQFVKLDYADPDLHVVKDNSADVVTCYVGLHHFPQDKVRFFLKEIRRVLRPGGHFLLVDHDIKNVDDLVMAHGVHILFNAINGTSLQDEMKELRLFAPMTHWRKLLEEAGLAYATSAPDVEMIRAGDSSRNRMVCFSKPRLSLVNGTIFQNSNRNEESCSLSTEDERQRSCN